MDFSKIVHVNGVIFAKWVYIQVSSAIYKKINTKWHVIICFHPKTYDYEKRVFAFDWNFAEVDDIKYCSLQLKNDWGIINSVKLNFRYVNEMIDKNDFDYRRVARIIEYENGSIYKFNAYDF